MKRAMRRVSQTGKPLLVSSPAEQPAKDTFKI